MPLGRGLILACRCCGLAARRKAYVLGRPTGSPHELRWLSLIQLKQAKWQFGLVGSEQQSELYDTPPPHYFGVPAVPATDSQGLAQALEAALAAPGPTVIETTVDPAHYMETVFDSADSHGSIGLRLVQCVFLVGEAGAIACRYVRCTHARPCL